MQTLDPATTLARQNALARSSVVTTRKSAMVQAVKPEPDDYFLAMIKQKGFCHVSFLLTKR